MKIYKLLVVTGCICLVSTLLVFAQESEESRRKDLKNQPLDSNALFVSDGFADTLLSQQNIDPALLREIELTKDPNLGYVPYERQLEAFKQIREIFNQRNTKRSGISEIQWEWRGPNNLVGAARALMFDPNDPEYKKIWAAANNGGLWVTSDITTDNNWESANGFMNSLTVTSIVYDPTNTNTFYVATNGATIKGIWKSIDGGLTWNHLTATNTSGFTKVNKLAMHKTGAILASTNSGIQRSSDGGETWSLVLNYSPIATDNKGNDLEVASNGAIYASLDFYPNAWLGSLHKSTDGGLTWSKISEVNGPNIEIAISPSNSKVVYITTFNQNDTPSPKMMKTTDGGVNWVEITKVNEGFTVDHPKGNKFFMMVSPSVPDRILLGNDNLYLSEDGGGSWNRISNPDPMDTDKYVGGFITVATRPTSNNEMVFGSHGGVYYSKNIDTESPSYIARNRGFSVDWINTVAIANNNNQIIAGTVSKGTVLMNSPTVGAAKQMTLTEADPSEKGGGFCFISSLESNLFVVASSYSRYHLSKNAGHSFIKMPNQPGDDVYDNWDLNGGDLINVSEFDSRNNILYSGQDRNIRIVKNINKIGTNVGYLSAPTLLGDFFSVAFTALKVSPSIENRLYAGANEGQLFIIDNANGAVRLKSVAQGINVGAISSIDVGDSENRLLVTLSNYGIVSVYQSLDSGQTWINKEGNLPDIPVYWGLYNPANNNEVMLATEFGVWITFDISASNPVWEPASEELLYVRCNMLKYRDSDGLVAVATNGKGIFTTNYFGPNLKPAAFFSSSETVAYQTEIQFIDQSANPNNSWLWSFGDGSTSSEQNPKHTYSSPGKYEVKLVISNGTSEMIKPAYITILPNKNSAYSLANGGNFETNANDFASLTLGGTPFQRGNSTMEGKSGTNSGQNAWVTGLNDRFYDHLSYSYLYTPNFLLGETGRKTLRFKTKFSFEEWNDGFNLEYSLDRGKTWAKLGTIAQGGWYNSYMSIDYNATRKTEAVFKGYQAEFASKYFDISSFAGKEIAFRFFFASDIDNNWNEDYTLPIGVVIDDFEIIDEPKAFFSVDKKISYVGNGVQFINKAPSTSTTWKWNFGDNTTSTAKNPNHIYTKAGNFTVTLTVNGGQSVYSSTVTILPDLPIDFAAEDGGDLEINSNYFASESNMFNPFVLGKHASLGVVSGAKTWVTNLSGSYADNVVSYLYFPNFLKPNATDFLSFMLNTNLEPGKDGAIMEYSTDKGETWNKLGSSFVEKWYNETSTGELFGIGSPMFGGLSEGFVKRSISLAPFAGTEHITFRLVFKSDRANSGLGMAIDNIEVKTLPDEEFEGDARVVYVGKEVKFVDPSINPNHSWLWHFGDNSSSTAEHPTHTYSQAGIYMVSLSINGNSHIYSAKVTVLPDLNLNFELLTGGDLETNPNYFATESPTGNEFVLGKHTSLGTVSGVKSWTTSQSGNYKNNTHSYLYFPNFKKPDSTSFLSFMLNTNLEHGKDGAIIEYSTNKGETWNKLGSNVTEEWYNTNSTGELFGISSPMFGGFSEGFVKRSISLAPFAGKANITFRLVFKSNSSNVGLGIAIDDIEVKTLIGAKFETDKSVVYIGNEVRFTDASTNPNNSWRWDFGDGKSSTAQNPAHKFAQAGKYTIKLAVNGGRSLYSNTVIVLPNLTLNFLLGSGGNLETKPNYFASESPSGHPFKLGKHSSLGTSSDGKTWVTNLGGNYENNIESYLYFPNFIEPDSTSLLSFMLNINVENRKDGAILEYSTDMGLSWNKLGNDPIEDWYNETSEGIFGEGTSIFSGVSGGFVRKSISLKQFDGEEHVAFRLVFKSDSDLKGIGLAIDDIEVKNIKARFERSKKVTYVGANVQFEDRSIYPMNTWQWDFGDGQTSKFKDPIYAYSSPGIYEVKLTLYNGEFVAVAPVIVLPNVESTFTLNDGGDLESDELYFATEPVIRGTGFVLGKNERFGSTSGDKTWVTGLSGRYKSYSETILYFPNFVLNESDTALFLSFQISTDTDTIGDGAYIEYSLDKGTSWKRLGTNKNRDWYNHIVDFNPYKKNIAVFSGINTGFVKKYYSLNGLEGEQNVAFRMVFQSSSSDNRYGIAVDDIQVTNYQGVLGIEEKAEVGFVAVYPNPVTNNVTYQLNNKALGSVTILVFDSKGILIDEIHAEKKDDLLKLEINMGKHANGIYLLKTLVGENVISNKLVKQ